MTSADLRPRAQQGGAAEASEPDRALPLRSGENPPAPVDFSRDVYCVFGLPFDAIGMDAAVGRVHQAVRERKRLFVSTPNLNFVIAAQDDSAFRQSVLQSQLSLADGMPIVWISRLLGIPLPERVSGAGLFETLCERPAANPVKVFFFGGPDGVAGAAGERVNAEAVGVRCVGTESPGFAPLEAISGESVVARINGAVPDFVVVSLGAKKGQAWILRNGPHLDAPVLSHLGAVVNFAAGAITRAPRLLQRLGLEWAWRIKEEPQLRERYLHDGVRLARLVLGGALPLSWERFRVRSLLARHAPVEHGPSTAGDYRITLGEVCGSAQLAQLRCALQQAAASRRRVAIDVTKTRYIDAAAMGSTLLLKGYLSEIGEHLQFVGAGQQLRRVFRLHGVEYLLDGDGDGMLAASSTPDRNQPV